MGVPNHEWRVEDGNSNFDMCDTYPPLIYVPASTTKAMVVGSSKFRSRGRLPVLSYLHPNGASITRCSQPLSGFSARCLEDEQLLQCILKTNSQSNTMYIIDTRPRINAVANRAAGKGYENEGYYANIQFKFCPIENIHIMRGSLQKVLEVCEMKNPTMNQYINALDNTSWLQHIKAVLDGAIFIARAIEIEKKNVLVHCSDGWDRTAQCCSLSSLLLCPYYRSIHGFRMLIEKEWLSFGHKFSDRCGHIRTNDNKEQSPVFLQFIEAVWQLSQLYPTAFEFNERFLISLHDHSHSCQYGNFIGNCEKDRLDLCIKERTYSYWNYVLQNVNDFKNPLFRPQSTYASEVLLPTINSQTLKFWLNMYHRFDSSILPRENIPNTLTHLIDHTISLNDHARLLEKRIRELQSILENEIIDEPMKASLPEHDSGISENELCQTKSDLISLKSTTINHPLSSSSDVESGINGDYSPSRKSSSLPFILQHQSNTETIDLPTLERITFELNSIALDWRSYNTPPHCTCALPFDTAQRKYNCWKCGENFCIRCIEHGIRLPGLYSNNFAPVCKTCTRAIKSSVLFIDYSTSGKSSQRNRTETKFNSIVKDQMN
jgi:myotubularin-related protein 6/7/8